MKRAPRGFSLIEILVSASLLAIVGALLLQSLSSSLDAKEAVETTSIRYHLVRSAMSRMCDELSMAYQAGQGHIALTEPRTKTGFHGEKDFIHFTAFGYVPRVEDEKKSDQRQLAFYLDNDPKTGTQALYRREQPNIDLDFEQGGRAQVLLPGVRSIEFTYWDDSARVDQPTGNTQNATVGSGKWLDKWDTLSPETNGNLPLRIKIKIVATMEDGQEQTFVSQTKLYILTPLTF
jgi:prepilin-type N-terminal cleavage/methylation domain-containing protein